MSTLTERDTTTMLAGLPRVNLLPPEIEEQRRFKRVQVGLGIGVLAAVGVVGVLVLSANAQVASAQDDLSAQQAQQKALQADAAKYADVPLVYAQVDAAEAQLSQAMGQEIRWSYFLNDLSLETPGKVWLTSVTATPNAEAATNAAPGATTTDTYLTPGLATVTFKGSGSKHNDVAAWLDALGKQKGLSQPYLTSSKVEPIGTEDAVTFESHASVNEDALSHRYTDKAGS